MAMTLQRQLVSAHPRDTGYPALRHDGPASGTADTTGASGFGRSLLVVAGLGRLARVCQRDVGERELRLALLAELRRDVPFDFYVWVLTDPETWVGIAPVASVPALADLPQLIGLKYRTPTNRWTALAPMTASSLLASTHGDPSSSRLWSGLLSGYGVTDVLSVAMADQGGCWGFLDLWRTGGSFSPAESARVTDAAHLVTPAVKRRLAATFGVEPVRAFPVSDPVVLLLSESLAEVTRTARVEEVLRSLLPGSRERPPIPAAAYNVAAQLVATEAGVDPHPPWARAHLGAGLWVTVAAARLAQAASDGPSIAVTIEPTPPVQRAALFSRVIGLTGREQELLAHLVRGLDTRTVAGRMLISEHTVQDHLKAVFAKAGVHNRRALVARATGMR
jgi:DNA-binding CsgD family transcriptional regulator